MKIIGILTAFIYSVSSALLLPVLLLLSALAVITLYQLGGFCSEYVMRKRTSHEIERQDMDIKITIFSPIVQIFWNYLAKCTQEKNIQMNKIEYLLQEKAWHMRKSLDFLGVLVRVGPMLGLMGTLIPMGTGLAALSQGDLGRLSSDLVIAFTTTVVGLAEGGIAYAILSIRRRWVEFDIMQMEYLADEILCHNGVSSQGGGISHGIP